MGRELSSMEMIKHLLLQLARLRTNKGYVVAGLPKFNGLFGRDSAIASWQLLSYDTTIARSTLAELSRLQGKRENHATGEQPGKIIHEYYSNDTSAAWFKNYKKGINWLKIGKPVYFSVDSTPLFLLLFSRYFSAYEDKELLRELWPNAIAALNWIFDYGIMGGFLRYRSYPKEKGLQSQSWKDGAGNIFNARQGHIAVVEVQGYLYYALMGMKKLLDIHDAETGEKAMAVAKRLKSDFNKKFWMPDERYFALALDDDDMQIRAVTSNPGQLLFSGILDNKSSAAVVERLFKKDMLTPYGIRTHSMDDTEFDPFAYQLGSVWPHDNWIIAQGLKAIGDKKHYEMIKKAILRAYKEMGSMPEYYGVSIENKLIPNEFMPVKPCDPQAWSVGAILNLLLT